MNILYTITRCWPAIGGAETHVRQVACALSARHDVSVIAHTNRQKVNPVYICMTGADQMGCYDDGPVHVQLLGATQVERLSLAPAARLYHYTLTKPLGYFLYAAIFASKLEAFVRDRRIDLIHNVLVGTEYLSHLSCQIARRCGVPFVITPLAHEGIWGDGLFFFKVYRQADAVISLLEVERELYIKGGVAPSRIHTIGVSPVIADSCDPAFFKEKYRLSGPIILFVGRQVESKGIDALLASASTVWQRHPAASFVLIGPMEKASSPAPRPPDPRILNLGPVPDPEKTSAIAACDLLCLPSNSEIMPTVILEAWSFGKPVIGGDIPALRELIEGAGGGIVVPQKPASIAQAILSMLDNRQMAQQYGEAGRRQVAERYTSASVAGQLEQVYGALCAGRTS